MLSDDSGRLSEPMRKVPINEILSRRMKEAGVPTAAELSRRTAAKRKPLSETAIKAILKRDGGTKDPGIFTVDSLAEGLEISTLRLSAEILAIDPDDPALRNEDLRMVGEIIKDLTPAQLAAAKPHIAGLLVLLKNIKNLSVK